MALCYFQMSPRLDRIVDSVDDMAMHIHHKDWRWYSCFTTKVEQCEMTYTLLKMIYRSLLFTDMFQASTK